MIIYRSQERSVTALSALQRVRESFRAAQASTSHQAVQQLLIDFGEFEAGVADAGIGEETATTLRRAAVATGHLLFRSWKQLELSLWTRQFCTALSRLNAADLPRTIHVSVPEGYAYYGLYPEGYLAAAERFASDKPPAHAVVIGIRSIGTSLSAAVAATLEEFGWTVDAHTIRPGGHPFGRVATIDDGLARDLRAAQTAEVLIVDEGPGLSGSSFGGVARAVREHGISTGRISLFPSWDADGSTFRNGDAAAEWSLHPRFTVAFDEIVKHPVAGTTLNEISAGRWREVFLRDEKAWPAVQIQHEARKFIRGSSLLKFAGLGRYGQEKLDLAETLDQERLAPPVLGLYNGFLETKLVSAVPFRPSGPVPQELLEQAARYLAFRALAFPREHSVPFDEMARMISFNTEQGIRTTLPDPWFAEMRREIEDRPATAVDGRMLAHEWIETPRGFLKTDAVDHHADHFFPGDTDIAWDLAAAAIEFRLDEAERRFLLERYQQLSGDRIPPAVLAYYATAWLAFRLGYCSMAAEATADRERERFQLERARYSGLLQHAVRALVHDWQVPA